MLTMTSDIRQGVSVFRYSVILMLALLTGCASSSHSPYSTMQQPNQRATVAAQRFNDKGLDDIAKGDDASAEKNFRRALEHDVMYAPAHNNLGLLLLRQGRHYEAAWEFQYAAKLMPHSPEPRNNLGILYEEIGQYDVAIDNFESALEIDNSNIEVMGHLARAYVKTGKKKDNLQDLLKKIIFISDDEQWDHWARSQLIRLNRTTQENSSEFDAPR